MHHLPQSSYSKRTAVVAHGNSLRGNCKYLKHIPDEEIVGLNLPTAVPYVFEFDNDPNFEERRFFWERSEKIKTNGSLKPIKENQPRWQGNNFPALSGNLHHRNGEYTSK